MGFLETKIEYLKGIGPKKAELLNKELGVFTFEDFLHHFPFRYEDRSVFYQVASLSEQLPYVQIKGMVSRMETIGEGRKKRLQVYFSDATGTITLVWFKGLQWVEKKLKVGEWYVVFGKPIRFGRQYSIAHPEFEPLQAHQPPNTGLMPIYPTTEKMKAGYLESKALSKLMRVLLDQALAHIEETLPTSLLERYRFMGRSEAVYYAHFPPDAQTLAKAQARLKFEELFFIQLRLHSLKSSRKVEFPGQVFAKIPTLNTFYKEYLPFDLTNAQKRVVREIFADVKSGKQMNRLLQGDVGSGKTIVAFICMLMAIDSEAQACMMAPTEILATQHYHGLKEFADRIGVRIALLTGSTKKSLRRQIDETLREGSLHIIVGTHALIEDTVDFKNLGLCIIDEQHRFGVAQRAKLWQKTSKAYPQILVMTATPIPRTLAMTLYGDLDVSVIDELPPGRKPVKTIHYYEQNRLRVFGFLKEQMELGRQVYIVYPLIEESEKLDYNNLMDGYESICRAFPKVPVSIVHGRMKPADKDFEMNRFVKGETKIMVATTVIEVGVNVPNASVMVIENAEKFGLSQLHQLRGRVGRGAEQSYCILMSSFKLSKEAKFRLETMVRTTDGFEIADADLKLRGPGDIEGTQQSGILDLKFADLAKDANVLQEAKQRAAEIIDKDPTLSLPEHRTLLAQVRKIRKAKGLSWGRIS